jgi:hypothetical protein
MLARVVKLTTEEVPAVFVAVAVVEAVFVFVSWNVWHGFWMT